MDEFKVGGGSYTCGGGEGVNGCVPGVEVVQQLTKMFKPDFKIIKKRIEDLISRDYLERDKDNPNVFKYLA